jgi:hypothetical protein
MSTHLGDGVYANHDPRSGALMLMSETNDGVSQIIFLEPSVLAALLRYLGVTPGPVGVL